MPTITRNKKGVKNYILNALYCYSKLLLYFRDQLNLTGAAIFN